jgi:hypothetical protein
MTLTLSSKSSAARRATRQRDGTSRGPDQAHARRRGVRHEPHLLGRYVDQQGRTREVLANQGAAGSTLVVDRDAATRRDRRLVAHLAPDEPAENAALVCRRYLEDVQIDRHRCRPVTRQDARTVPFAAEEAAPILDEADLAGADPIDKRGQLYRLELVETGMSIPELRWRRHGPPSPGGQHGQIVSLREAVAGLEGYQPVIGLTLRMLARHRCDPEVSTTVLRAELVRVQNSPIVLNRGLREAVLANIERHQLSMSEIAIRCGRVKRDRRGNESGETSWLARRLGLLPEAGQGVPTKWIHSDVLALIARRGLGIRPRGVELA